jgi:predicted hydrocarbon binding protein
MLTALGFGPDTALMNDPKLFIDMRFLASLISELDDELGGERASLTLFQIGLLHGLRDAARVCRTHEYDPAESAKPIAPETTSLVMDWGSGTVRDEDDSLSIVGCWPERHEAMSRCSRLGAPVEPGCWMSAGYTTGWLSGTLNRALIVREVECAATGAAECRFEAREVEDWRQRSEETIEWILAEVPFEAFRKVAIAPPIDRGPTPSLAAGQFDRSQSVVHIWGPVMVLPFTTVDEALGTVDMLGRDEGINDIRAVVVDLREQPLDEGFGAAALEQILETVESWNAQRLITGVSSAAEAVVTSIEGHCDSLPDRGRPASPTLDRSAPCAQTRV